MRLPGVMAAVLVPLVQAQAHRLDEYLQATRIAVSTNHIELSIDLTPGVAVAEQILVAIDRDHDGHFSKEETRSYALQVLTDISIQLDGRPLQPGLTDVTFPTRKEAAAGLGVIRIKASAINLALAPASHQLSLTNKHLPVISVYQVNALKPKDSAIEITRQLRDELQRSYRLEFRVLPASLTEESRDRR